MMNLTLYRREMKGSLKLLLIFAAIMTMYVSIIIGMFDPELMKTLDNFAEVMPELMAAVGMTGGATTLLGFMISYLYGFVLLIFPMVFSMLRGNGLIAKYVDRGSMAALVAAPVKRSTIASTQMCVLLSGILLLMGYVTGLELVICHISFPGELETAGLLGLNVGLYCLHVFIAGICFLASCCFSDTKYALAFGAGIPALMYVIQMLVSAGDQAEFLKYATCFTLFDATGLAAGETRAFLYAGILLAGGILMFAAGIAVFSRKDLHI